MIRSKNHKDGFTIIEVIMAMAITGLVLTPIFIMHGMILERVRRASTAFQAILYGKSLLYQARQKQDPDAQEFSIEKHEEELDANCIYNLEKTMDQKSSLASILGLHKEAVNITWKEDGQKKQELLVTFVYKKPEQKKS